MKNGNTFKNFFKGTPIVSVGCWSIYDFTNHKKKMNYKIFLSLGFFVFIMLLVNAETITLVDMNVEIGDDTCIGNSIFVKIIPLDYNNSFVEVNSISFNVSGSNVTYEKIYLRDNNYVASFLIENHTDLPVTVNFNVLVNQSGKYIVKSKQIIISEICDKSNLSQKFNINSLFDSFMLFLVVILLIVVIMFFLGKVYK